MGNRTSSSHPPVLTLLHLIQSATLASMLDVDEFKPLRHLVPRDASLTSSMAACLWVTPEHVGLYLVRDLMPLHWGCLSHRQPHSGR
ncbi:hypothetical protein EYF80_032013 [Liparis tanakae]|uniref:Uncharacterized protein n=1 Tax=Liparis tanakae TaxID=230148 RepID=A0A4Z2GX94_9TELE|nr:hypothetical protein EYF80_032013 [Liparis tanakae]